MSDIQLKRSTDLYDHAKPRRLRESDKTIPASAPTSASPGRWLSEIIVDALLPDESNPPEPRTEEQAAQYVSAVEILNAYRLVPRYKRLRYPTELIYYRSWEKELPATKFIEDEFETLETKSLCFGFADIAAMKADDDSSSFSMLGQDGVLSGIQLHEYQTNRAKELEGYKATRKPAKKTKGKAADSKVKNKYDFIPDDVMDAAYRTWFIDPNDANKEILWKTLHNFFSRETSLARKGDDLHAQGESDDFQQNLVIRLMGVLEKMAARGKEIEQPSNYLRRTWKNCRITAFEKLDKANRTWLPIEIPCSDGDGAPSNDESCDAPNHLDEQAYKNWADGNNATGEATEDPEVIRQRRLAMLPMLRDDIRDVVGMHLAGKTQTEIGTEKGVSQQAVSKTLKKAAELLQAMQHEAATK
ncbi:hypothetical protein [Edaphobacter sp. DSM 109919]|uniref:Sigma-70 family RNA polymerase sigma factor n=1 Tax=Edaphobacter paludis TaxID=3035702 RepID=A0AAU7CUU9_9BACT